MKGVRYWLPSGDVVEFTHHAGCLQPESAWVEAHKKAAVKSRVDVFDSPYPVHRRFNLFGDLIEDSSDTHGTSGK